MTRLPTDSIEAAAGMDNTSDLSLLPEATCQLLNNLLNDRAGLLRANVSTPGIPGLSNYPASVDGIGVFPPTDAYYTPGLAPPPSRFVAESVPVVVVASGGLFYFHKMIVPPAYLPTFAAAFFISTNTYVAGAGIRVRFAVMQGELYAVVDQSPYGNTRCLASGVTYRMGLPTPPAPTITPNANGASNKTAGTLTQYTQTLVDSLGRESSPSAIPATILWSANQDAILTANTALTGPDVAGINLYATQGNGTAFFLIHTFPPTGGTFEDNLSDSAISAGAIAPNFGEDSAPQPATIITYHQNRLWMDIVGREGWIQVSNQGSATQFANPTGIGTNGLPLPADGGQLQISQDSTNAVMGLVSLGPTLLVLLRRSISVILGVDSTDFTVQEVYREKGCIAKDSVVRCGDHVLFLADDGVYAVSFSGGFVPQKISGPIESTLFDLNATPAGRALLEAAVACYVDHSYNIAINTSLV